MAKRPLPTPDRLRQLLDYNPATGVLKWRPREGKWSARWNARYAGQPAGGLVPEGYIFLKVDDVSLAAHRVIWAMVYDCWPPCVDHKNGKRADNRLKNLRSVSRKINQRNQRTHRTNSSGRTGVHWNSTRNCWVAQIKIDNVSRYLGSFDAFDDAVKARRIAEKQHQFTGRA